MRCLEGIQKLRRRDRGKPTKDEHYHDWHISTGSTYMCLLCNKVLSKAIYVGVCAFLQSGSVHLPTGRCDSLHSNYGSVLFLRSTLETMVQMVQSQTCIEQHELGGHRKHSHHKHNI